MQCQVETFPFYLLCHAKPNKDPDHGQNDQAGYGAIAEDDCNTNALVKELSDVALEHAGRATVLFDGKDSGQQCADDSADRMHTEAVESVVVPKHALEARAAPVTEHASAHTDGKSADWTNETGRRRNGHETRNGPRANANDGGLAAQCPFDEHPCKRRDSGGNLGHQHGHASLHTGRDGRPRVETEPADPEKGCADKRQYHVMCRPNALALAEHKSAHQTGDTRIDMDNSAAGKVQDLDVGGLVASSKETVWAPHPMRNRGIDENGP